MEYRMLGKTDLEVSALGFGCGAVGGLMVRGAEQTMTQAVARALEAGITYFDTAQMYGDGESETNLGRVLKELLPGGLQAGADKRDVVVGSKVQLHAPQMENIYQSILDAAEISLQRLQLDVLDLYQLHNSIGAQRDAERRWLGVDDLEPASEAFQQLQAQGKIRYWGINGLGESDALLAAVDKCGADTIQVCYNLLNPSAGQPVGQDFPYQNYKQLIDRAVAQGMGAIAIRVLAAGALSGQEERHPVAAQSVGPIASGASYSADVIAARRFHFLIDEGWADSLVEAAIRFAMSKDGVGTALVGLSSLDQLEEAIAAAERGPLPAAALNRLPAV